MIFGIFLGDFSYRLVGGIISPCMNGIYAWIAIDDDALRRLTIDGNDRISASGRTARRDHLPAMLFDDFPGLRKIFLRISLGVGYVDLPDQVNGRFAWA